MKSSYTVHTDGGSRGNPGPSACAFVAKVGGEVVFENSKFLGNGTNNVAEYQGLVEALLWLSSQNDVGEITVCMDSELVVKQMLGQYKVKDLNMRKKFEEVQLIKKNFVNNFFIKHVRREENKRADELVNIELDKNTG